MFQPLVLGIVAGFVTSVGIGPLTLAAVSRSLRNGLKAGLAVGAGAAVMDVLVISLLGLGIAVVRLPGVVLALIGSVVGLTLVLGGVRVLFGSQGQRFSSLDLALQNPYPPTQERLFAHGAVGAMVYIVNPYFLILWGSLLSILQAEHMLAPEPFSVLPFAFGAGVGTAGFFWILLVVVQRFASRLSVLKRTAAFVPFVEIVVGTIITFQSWYHSALM